MSPKNLTSSSAAPTVSAHVTPEMVRDFRRSRSSRLRLTPEVLQRQLEQFEAGHLRDFALTADSLPRRDDRIAVAWPKRCKAVSRRGITVQQNDGLPAEQVKRAEEHKAAIQYAFDHCTVTHALDLNQRGGYRLLIRQMMEALGILYSVHEIVWEPIVVDGKPRLTFTAIYVPLWFFENTTGRLRFLRNPWSLDGEPLAEGEWLITVGESLMQPLAAARAFKQMALIDWLAYSEKFGMPGLLGKTSAQKNTDAWTAMEDAVESFSQDWAAVCSTGDTIELVEASGGGANLPYPPLVERMDRAIVSICRGGDLSTMSQQGESSGSNRQGEETELLEEDDAEMVSETMQQISRIIIRELFDEEPLAYATIVVPRTKSTADTVKKIETLVGNGVPVGAAWARGELGVPAPAEGEPILTPAAPAPISPLVGALATANAAEAASAAVGTLFRHQALLDLSEAQRAQAAPLLERLAAVQRAADPTAYATALRSLHADWDQLTAPLRTDTQLARALEQVLGTAAVSGIAAAPSLKPAPKK